MTEANQDQNLVIAFCDSWASGDLECVLSFLAEDAEWENVPTGSIHGKIAIREKLATVFKAADRIEWQVLHASLSADGHVLTERIDRIVLRGRTINLRLMGIFLVVNGKIKLWRDYFDMANYQRDMGPPAW